MTCGGVGAGGEAGVPVPVGEVQGEGLVEGKPRSGTDAAAVVSEQQLWPLSWGCC